MDERWKCPNCGFQNDYIEDDCVSCETPRPDYTQTAEVADEAVDSPVFTSYLRDLDYRTQSLDLPLYAPRPEPEQPSETIPGSLPMPTLEPLSAPPPVPIPTSTRAEKRTKSPRDPTSPKVPSSRPPSRKVPVRLLVVIALAGIAAAIATSLANNDTTTSTTSVTDLSIVSSHADDAYFDDLVPINEARNGLVNITNERWDAWLELDSDGFPTAEYLVMDELVAFQDKVRSITMPVSDEVKALHDTWTTDLNSLVLAEQALAASPDQATLDAELEAWQTENASYTTLYDYMQARE